MINFSYLFHVTVRGWGTFSVKDHSATKGLITDLLLYNRLVIPVPNSDLEKQLWEDEKWNFDVLERRLEVLGDLPVKVRWDEEKRNVFQQTWKILIK